MTTHKVEGFTVEITKEGDEYRAEVKELPGCKDSGPTRKEALRRIRTAIHKYVLEIAKKEGARMRKKGIEDNRPPLHEPRKFDKAKSN